MKKIYLVFREVIAKDIVEAAKAKGKIYQISLADDYTQLKLKPEKPMEGFKKK